MDVDELIKSGTHKWCPTCRQALILVARRTCTHCVNSPTASAIPSATAPPPKKASSRTFHPPTDITPTRIRPSALGELAHQDDHCLWIVAAGKPVTQGSMKAVGGVVKHSAGPELHEWRNTITREALRAVAGRWEELNIPVRLDVVLTVPNPKTVPAWSPMETEEGFPRIPPMVPPDVDKLLRAVQDALSPQDNRKKGEEAKTRDRRFRLLVDDARIVDSNARKTYPRPRHTHAWALDYPGAVIRVTPLGSPVAALPPSTLSLPGDFPSPAHEMEKAVRRRTAL